MQNIKGFKGGFALPTVLIASVVMLVVLTVSVSSVLAVRTTLMAQYYEQMAKTAGEAGVAYAKACLAKNGNVPLWSDAKPLTPATDCAGNLALTPQIKVLVVAGGGGGGAGIGGGGGGGGVLENSAFDVGVGSYSVTVGAGGAGGVSTATGAVGGNSSFNGVITANGGGGGGGRIGTGTYNPATSGGSGGGGNGTYEATTGSGAPGAAGIAGQGNSGGMGSAGSTGSKAGNGGGGGGAGASGGNASGTASGTGYPGDGGNGVASTISGISTMYGGGGSGGRWGAGTLGLPGLTGGGVGSVDGVAGAAGLVNTGGGGGGGGSSAANGGAGGSGTVIISYPSNGSITASTTGTVTSYLDGVNQVKVFKTSGNFIISAISSSSCPTDPRCSVMIDGNARSSFKVGLPRLDSTGKAVEIPNNGYTELLRSSNGEVWRTFNQPSVQAAVVPELCSGAATSALGWSNAQLASSQSSLPDTSSARSIAASSGSVPSGQVYFRRDFMVQDAGSYIVSASTPTSGNRAQIYIDGNLVVTTQGSLKSGNKALSAGCHVITVNLWNNTGNAMTLAPASFIAAVQRNANTPPVAATDTTWRVSSGGIVDFSSPDFYADPDVWSTAYDYDSALKRQASWTTSSSDPFSRMITPNHSGCPATNCPANSYTFLRDSHDFILASSSSIKISALCDDNCVVYLDGSAIISSAPWSTIAQYTATLAAGSHHIGVKLSNGGAGQSGVAVSVYNVTTSTIIDRTDSYWQAANVWYTGTTTNTPTSYANSFKPNPSEIARPATLTVLVVAGGGGGAGNCTSCGGAGGGGGGGVIYSDGMAASVGSYTVTVGGGGAGGAAGTQTGGTNGSSSVFGSLTAVGGGAGMGQNGTAGKVGGSGGGGSGGGTPAPGAGGAGTAGQGSKGGAGLASPYGGGGGGGAGGFGVTAAGTVSGNGGAGFMSYLDGSLKIYGAGGGGGAYTTNTAGLGESTSGNGVNQNTNNGNGYAGNVNRGGGGGGANGQTKGGAGGAGGTGVVIVRYVAGTLTATGGTISSATINGVTYTIHTFTASGTFSITSIN